jgi:hypothetical protein
MDTITTLAPKERSAFSTHIFHVYRHVDIEKLQSKAEIAPNPHIATGLRARNSVSKPTAFHGKPSLTAIAAILGGSVWNA